MNSFRHLFGPVPSRRFGLSLGVDLVPRKTCTLDCIFCEVGPTTARTLERREYVPTDAVLGELDAWFARGESADAVTVTGSGEPTLHTRFGEVLEAIRARGRARAVLLTNSTLLPLPEVRAGAARADLVKATLPGWDQASFAALTRPVPGLEFDEILEGLRRFRAEFRGLLWLEIFLVPGLNAAPDQVRRIAALARTIRPDRVQLNTAVRPTAARDVPALDEARLRELAALFGPAAELIARFAPAGGAARRGDRAAVLAMLRRRPCTADDVAQAFGLTAAESDALIRGLDRDGLVRAESRQGQCFWMAR